MQDPLLIAPVHDTSTANTVAFSEAALEISLTLPGFGPALSWWIPSTWVEGSKVKLLEQLDNLVGNTILWTFRLVWISLGSIPWQLPLKLSFLLHYGLSNSGYQYSWRTPQDDVFPLCRIEKILGVPSNSTIKHRVFNVSVRVQPSAKTAPFLLGLVFMTFGEVQSLFWKLSFQQLWKQY